MPGSASVQSGIRGRALNYLLVMARQVEGRTVEQKMPGFHVEPHRTIPPVNAARGQHGMVPGATAGDQTMKSR